MEELIPVNNKEKMVGEIRRIAEQISFDGLTQKQKDFCLGYAGDKILAAKNAGYKNRSRRQYHQLIMELMLNDRIRANIQAIDKMLARFCVASAVEIKMLLSERIRSGDITDTNLAAFTKILLQTQGELSDKLIIEKTQTNVDIAIEAKIKADLGFSTPIDRLLQSGTLLSTTDQPEVIDVTPIKKSGIEDIL